MKYLKWISFNKIKQLKIQTLIINEDILTTVKWIPYLLLSDLRPSGDFNLLH